MRARHALWIVYRKELCETLRDRRTLIVMVVLPVVLYPLVGVFLTEWVGAEQKSRLERPTQVAIEGPPWPALERALLKTGQIKIQRGATERAVRDGAVDAVLKVPPGYQAQLDGDGTVALTLEYDETRDRSALARDRLRAATGDLAREIRSARLQARTLPRGFLEPLRTEEHSSATPRDVRAHLMSGFLPFLVTLMVLLGAFYPAIDLTAGEKERGTLETLLAAPVPRTSLLGGKFLVVATVAMVTGMLNLGSVGLTFVLGFGRALRAVGITSVVPWSTVALTAAAMVPASLFFAALMVAVASLARSFKEAQNLLTPVYMVCIVPAAVAEMPGINLTPWTALVPVANVALLTRDIIGGRIEVWPLVLVLLSTAVYAVITLQIAARIYSGERLLFAALDRPATATRSVRRYAPNPAEAALLLLVIVALILILGQAVQAKHFILGILVTEWVLIGLPVLILLRLGSLDHRQALGLLRPGFPALLGAVLAGLSGWYLVGVLVESLQQRVLPMPKEMIDEMRRLLFATDRSVLVDLLALALSPAICEELLFRGVLLRASWPALKMPAAIALNGILFGLFHVSIYRFLPTCLLGMVLAFIVLRSGSIFAGMTFHFVNNASALLVGRHVPSMADSSATPSATATSVALVLFVVGLLLVSGRSGITRSEERARPDH
jgi:sodium transport system permease protein